jgi:hypothetical protein
VGLGGIYSVVQPLVFSMVWLESYSQFYQDRIASRLFADGQEGVH